MDIIKICVLSLTSIFILFVLTKLMGNREMGQLSMFDYVVSITIGSIAAEMATSLENNFIEPLTAMVIYAIVTILISIINSHSLKVRRFIAGKTLVLLDKGKLYRANFKKSRLDINEFLMECRSHGYFDISEIETTILEPNGKISFLPKTEKKPVSAEDMNLKVQQEGIPINVILDGCVIKENLKHTGHDLEWLQKQMRKQNILNVKDVFLATYDKNDNLSIYTKINRKNAHDRFA